MLYKERILPPTEAFKMALAMLFKDTFPGMKGRVILHMTDSRTGEVLEHWERDNIITLDAGILAARLFRNPAEPAHGANMLAVGTGALGPVLAPNAPDSRQRKLNAEIARKAFASTTFRDVSGNAVAYPTNTLDLTCSFGEGEAVGPLTEMGILSTVSANPLITNSNPNNFPVRDVTLDLTLYDILINYLTFGAITKASTAILSITWRLTF